MRILVATKHTVPGYSGGWTTPLDLFGESHQAMYVIGNYPPLVREVEGVKVAGAGAWGCLSGPWSIGEGYRDAIFRRLFKRVIKEHFHRFRADFVLCLDPSAGYAAMEASLPYAMRFHSRLHPEHLGHDFDGLLRNSVFNISGPTTGAEGIEEIPHNQDLSRFRYVEHGKPERAVLLTSIDDVHEPEVFLEGIMASRNMKGDIVGTGPAVKRIARLCSRTGGRVRCLRPVPRLQVPGLLTRYQVGVATVRKIAPVVYQMKVNAYMASGLYTLAKPWTHIAEEAPGLISTFTTPGEMGMKLDWLQDNWDATLETRRNAREWICRNYSVEIPRKRFEEILRKSFPCGNGSR